MWVNSEGELRGDPGQWLKHFTYDAYGRLVRTQVPWPWLDEEPLGVATRRFYYDGGRRIQERVTTPVPIGEDGKEIAISEEMGEFELTYP